MSIDFGRRRKPHTGYEIRIKGFVVPHLFVHRAENGLYDVYIHVKEPAAGGSFFDGLFGEGKTKTYQHRISTGVKSRKEAVTVARSLRDSLFAVVAQQIMEWDKDLSRTN